MFEKVTIEGGELHCHVHRIDKGAPWLLFSNSLLTDMSIFEAQFSAFSESYNIIRYDQRGHGQSAVSAKVDFDLLAQDVLSILDQVNVSECIFIGLSMGVPTALATFELAPDRIKALILMDGQSASAPDAAEQWQARIDTAVANGLDKFSATTAERWLVSESGDKYKRLVSMMKKTPMGGFIAAASALKSYDYRHVLSNLTVPVLTMAGAQDGAMPAKMKAIASALENCDFVEIAQAGHVPCFEQSDAVNAAMESFLQRVTQA